MIEMKVVNAEALKQQLNFLQLKRGERRQLHRWLAAGVATKSRQRTKRQQDVDGKKFAPRKSKTNKRKMLRKISNTRYMRPSNVTAEGADVTWPKTKAGMIARVHQKGHKIRISKQAKVNTETHSMATRWQARSLNEVGFKLKRKGIKVRVSQKWIMKNMSSPQAGAILRTMRNKKSAGKTSWTIKVPARPFLGVSRRQQKQLSEKLMNQMMEKIRR